MRTDDFEARLRRSRPKAVPAHWRADILAAAQAALPSPSQVAGAKVNGATRRLVPARAWWQEWFWPCPQAWAGLAAVWVLILAIKCLDQPLTGVTLAAINQPASRDGLAVVVERHKDLAKLLEAPATRTPTPPALPLRPRTQREERQLVRALA